MVSTDRFGFKDTRLFCDFVLDAVYLESLTVFRDFAGGENRVFWDGYFYEFCFVTITSTVTGLNKAAAELGRTGSGVSRLRTSRKLSCLCSMSFLSVVLGPITGLRGSSSTSSSSACTFSFLPDPKNVNPPFLIDLFLSENKDSCLEIKVGTQINSLFHLVTYIVRFSKRIGVPQQCQLVHRSCLTQSFRCLLTYESAAYFRRTQSGASLLSGFDGVRPWAGHSPLQTPILNGKHSTFQPYSGGALLAWAVSSVSTLNHCLRTSLAAIDACAQNHCYVFQIGIVRPCCLGQRAGNFPLKVN